MQEINVILIDDHAVVREGYRRLLERDSYIKVVAEGETGNEGYRLICDHLPDVVVMDITLPGMSGIEVTRRVLTRVPEQKILIFSMHEEIIFVNRAFQAGAKGYVTKSAAPEVLIDAVRQVAMGKLYLSSEMAQLIAAQTIPGGEQNIDLLSGREFEIFRLLVQGQSLHEISEALHIAYKTVANYQSNIRQKLGATTAAQIVRIALDHGIISSADKA
ncbi:MAG TPA: DNA-binding response regulator [Betaproteobacteria bacterium]|jgi:two-component system, NarL family, invasion response regulator UvrY|nr:DNA-binding response regulator [Betaproteobacteria bacterium]